MRPCVCVCQCVVCPPDVTVCVMCDENNVSVYYFGCFINLCITPVGRYHAVEMRVRVCLCSLLVLCVCALQCVCVCVLAHVCNHVDVCILPCFV